jgi:hypothetical protein
MLYFIGITIILLINSFIFYDQKKLNDDFYKNNPLMIISAILILCVTEILLYTLFYIALLKIIELLT